MKNILYTIILSFLFLSGVVEATPTEEIVLDEKNLKNIFRPSTNEIQSLLTKKEELWYGAYYSDSKVGWLHWKTGTRSSNKLKKNSVYEALQKSYITFLTEGNDGLPLTTNFTSETKHTFETTHPFNLLEYEEKNTGDNSTSTVLGREKGENFEVTYNADGVVSKKILINLNESLYNSLSVDAWLARKERVKKDNIIDAMFDFNMLDYMIYENKIKDIVTSKVNGIDYSYYVVDMKQIGSNFDEVKLEVEVLIDKKGNLLNFSAYGFEFRLEDKKNAKNLDESFDLFTDLSIDINPVLADGLDEEEIQTIIYEVIGDAKSIYEGGIQHIKELDNGNTRLTVSYDKNKGLSTQLEKATQKELEFYIRDIPQYPYNAKIISELLSSAVKNGKNNIERIVELRNFVSEYIEDDYESNSLSVFNTIKTKKGDCTEHAHLFTTLARAAGFSTKEVGGWAYDGNGRFVPHAWAEVAVKMEDDYYWLPVDPTWDINIPVVHIKESPESFLGKFSLIPKKVIFANGEKILY